MTPTSEQLRHACGLLRWSPLMLVWNAKISHESANRICQGQDTAEVPEDHLRAVQGALETACIEFTADGPRLKART